MLDLSLEHLYRAADASVSEPWLLVLMHGVGSNEGDLFGLAEYVPHNFHVLSLRAPIVMAPGMYGWFQFGINPDGSRTIDEVQERASRALVEQTCAMACKQLNVPSQRVVLGGFSQGGIMALSVLLTRPALLKAVMVWHSRLLPEIAAQHIAVSALRGRSAWVSHGTVDDVIPVSSARDIRALLETKPVDLQYHEYPCRHELHPQELRESMRWLQSLGGEPGVL